MTIVFAASEAAPLVKTGGLGDVAQALPYELSRHTHTQVLLFLPYYKSIKEKPGVKVERVAEFTTTLSWRHQYVGLYRVCSKRRKLQIYLIDNESYFLRDRAYGYPDDGERFAYFSKAILESLCVLGVHPDILHCNDWQTALIPPLLHAFYHEKLGSAKTVFTIHNIEYQGWEHPYFLGDVLGLSTKYDSLFHFHDGLNFMKGAILSCDALTTVSRSYAREICDPYFAAGLDEIIREHEFKLHGIVNGIDQASCDPSVDPALIQNYTVSTFLQGKAACKAALRQELGLADQRGSALIGMVSRLVSHKGMDLVCDAIEELMQWNVQIAILGTGDKAYEERLRAVSERHPDRFSLNLRFSTELASRIYAASDLYLMPSKSEPCGLSQMIAMRFGAVPIVHETGGLRDTVLPFLPQTGEGVGFTFQSYGKDHMLDALRRALTVFGGDPAGFQKAVTNCMTSDFSWKRSAGEYLALYSELIKKANP